MVSGRVKPPPSTFSNPRDSARAGRATVRPLRTRRVLSASVREVRAGVKGRSRWPSGSATIPSSTGFPRRGNPSPNAPRPLEELAGSPPLRETSPNQRALTQFPKGEIPMNTTTSNSRDHMMQILAVIERGEGENKKGRAERCRSRRRRVTHPPCRVGLGLHHPDCVGACLSRARSWILRTPPTRWGYPGGYRRRIFWRGETRGAGALGPLTAAGENAVAHRAMRPPDASKLPVNHRPRPLLVRACARATNLPPSSPMAASTNARRAAPSGVP
jgi:hypothetical protein